MGYLTSLDPLLLLVVVAAEIALIGWGSERVTGFLLYRTPWRPLAYPFLLPGTVLHELAHAAAALAMGLGVAKVVLFHPTESPDGSWTLGWVVPKRSGTVRRALMGVAPLLLVPPLLLLIAAVLASFPMADMGPVAVIGLVVLGLGSLGAFPSPEDVSVSGWLLVGAIFGGLGLLAFLVGGPDGLTTVLAGTTLLLSVPALVFLGLVVAAWVVVEAFGEEAGASVVVIRERPAGLYLGPRPPRPLWPGPRGRR